MKAIIILANIKKINKDILKDSYIIGCDRGAYIAAINDIVMDVAIGDFDSVNDFEFKLIKKFSKNVTKLNPIKDLTDTKEAINLCANFDSILILGGIKGHRIEHFYANLIELCNDKRISMMDEDSLIETHDYSFKPNNNYKYVSFFSISNESIISLEGFSYKLDNYILKNNDPLCISNEILNNPYVDIKMGRILTIYSKNDHELN